MDFNGSIPLMFLCDILVFIGYCKRNDTSLIIITILILNLHSGLIYLGIVRPENNIWSLSKWLKWNL